MNNRCPCGCGSELVGRQRAASTACRKRISRQRQSTASPETVTGVTKCDAQDPHFDPDLGQRLMTPAEFEEKLKLGWHPWNVVEVANCYCCVASRDNGREIETWYLSKHGWPQEPEPPIS